MRQQLLEQLLELGSNARQASRSIAVVPDEQKQLALHHAADQLIRQQAVILAANEKDIDAAGEAGLDAARIDRLKLNAERLQQIATSVRAIAGLPDPVGEIIASWQRPNGLTIERVRTPLGVIGVIYESRPNVTADAGALCLKSGNAVILRGGRDAWHSSAAILSCLQAGLAAAELPPTAIQMIPTPDRAAVGEMLAGLNGNLDVIVPRGGKSLVARVQEESRVPVFAHLEGICHVYIDREADLAMAISIVENSKLRRPGICGAAETMLIDRNCLDTHLVPILQQLADRGCELRGDAIVCERFPTAKPSSEDDWSTEYLAPVLSIKCVDGVDDAIEHIAQYSSGHTESIVTENRTTASQFLQKVDSAIVMHNASTQFADGGEFGMGAEIGIATGRFHARGPVGVEQLTTFKYRVHGNGQLRPVPV